MDKELFFETAAISKGNTTTVNTLSKGYSPISQWNARNINITIDNGVAKIRFEHSPIRLTFDPISVSEDEVGTKYREQDVKKRKFTWFGLLSPYYVKGWYYETDGEGELLNTSLEITTSNFDIIS